MNDTIFDVPLLSKEKVTGNGMYEKDDKSSLPDILFITSYPPRECGIATYTQDLVAALGNQFSQSFTTSICAIESDEERHEYNADTRYILNIDYPKAFRSLAKAINTNEQIQVVILQHEFGFFRGNEHNLKAFLELLKKPVIIVFHTVLPARDTLLREQVIEMTALAVSIIVMTASSKKILVFDYEVPQEKIKVIPHGTHLVPHADREQLKRKWGLAGKKVLSTFGLLSSGKNIETTLRALPAIIKHNPDLVFLVIGKTHPSVEKQEGFRYRNMLDVMVKQLFLEHHVNYINYYLPLPDLLEYLQLTDIYLFTSNDPNQAVSGTFSYALSCGCPVVSTPIPHAVEVLGNDAGIIIDFESPEQLSQAVNRLFKDEVLMKNISSNGLHRMAPTAWQNAAIAHAMQIEKMAATKVQLKYTLPPVKLSHLIKLTTGSGMVQFSCINQPDIKSGYTLDDNARALIVMCQHYELTNAETDIPFIKTYLRFISHCLQPGGFFLNYVDEQYQFTEQNNSCNLADANGRAIWALGYLLSISSLLDAEITANAAELMQMALLNVKKIHSTRAMAFIIKGLYYRHLSFPSEQNISLTEHFAGRLVQMYRHEADGEWQWFESYLTYANSTLSEAMLCAWLTTGNTVYKETAVLTFEFLLARTFRGNTIRVISNKNWLLKSDGTASVVNGGEQPIDVAYTIIALSKFHQVFGRESYATRIEKAFSWFLGANHLHQIIYNPCTGGCYDGLEENCVNLNQGAESTVSYLMARLTLEKHRLAVGVTKNNSKMKSMPLAG
jgi:glycosyltransferase involved in cell wall biosynthesis